MTLSAGELAMRRFFEMPCGDGQACPYLVEGRHPVAGLARRVRRPRRRKAGNQRELPILLLMTGQAVPSQRLLMARMEAIHQGGRHASGTVAAHAETQGLIGQALMATRKTRGEIGVAGPTRRWHRLSGEDDPCRRQQETHRGEEDDGELPTSNHG